ncbi:MAG: coenzyme F420 hydrogenase subunit alpha [Candidatus Methanofastidiosia archaeon]
MTSTVIEINPSTRLEGHAKIILDTDDDGIIHNAYFLSTSMVRGFEYLVRGRNFGFANTVVQRICGICPIPHGLASVEAVENALDTSIPSDAKRLRELLLIGNKIQSHALHQYLILDDLAINGENKVDVIERIQEIRRLAQKIVDVIGGEAIHPSNVCVGGMRTNITPYAAAMLYRVMRKCERIAKIQRDFIVETMEKMIEELPFSIKHYQEAMLSTHMTYGDRNGIDMSAITEITPYRFYQADEAGRNTNIMIPLYYGDTVEVGPRARYTKYKDFRGETPLHINIARAREMMILVYRAVEILDDISTSKPVFKDYIIKSGEGIGVIEAPRGTNIHKITLDKKGIVTKYNMIVPTTWNMPTIERALKGNHHSIAEFIVRSYDPCVECATHQIILRDLDKNVCGRRYFR